MFKAEIKNVKVGDVIKFNEKCSEENFFVNKQGTVIAVYKNHVLLDCGKWKKSVCLGTLVMLGLEEGGNYMYRALDDTERSRRKVYDFEHDGTVQDECGL